MPRTLLLGAALLGLGACSASVGQRIDAAYETAAHAQMQPAEIPAGKFLLTSFSHVTQPGHPANIYIEGDGLAWLTRHTPSRDPTPKNPVGLKLAARDGGANVIYMARPCQYTRMTGTAPCPAKYWTSDRFAPDVIDAMNAEIDTLKQRHGITGINLIGFSGGAGVAVLLAARRNDVTSLRTVAGNLDYMAMSRVHNISPMRGSLNPADAASRIAGLPQRHFIGNNDSVITPAIYRSYRDAAGPSACIRSQVVASATHTEGWVERWPELLRQAPECGPSE